MRNFAWQEGYSIFSVSQSQMAAVQNYVRRQEKHHQVKTFREELLAFLRAHNVEFEERYVFD